MNMLNHAISAHSLDVRRLTLIEAVDLYRAQPGGSPWKHNKVRAIREAPLGAMKLPHITRATLRRWCEKRLERVRVATVRNELALIRRAIETARREFGLVLPDNPALGVQLSDRERRLTPEELERLRMALEDAPVVWALVLVAVETELTRGVLLKLAWRDIDLDQAVAHVRQSAGGQIVRSVALRPAAVDALRLMQRPSGKVFPIAVTRLRWTWEAACRRAGVRGVWFYEVRHVLRRTRRSQPL